MERSKSCKCDRPLRRRAMATSVLLIWTALSLTWTVARAQVERITIVVDDAQSRPIPYALVSLGSGLTRVADDSGHALFLTEPKDSLRLHVRRIGFTPFIGWVRRSGGGAEYQVMMDPLVITLDTVAVTARRNTPLARTGFYDRVQRVQRGAFAARMITPEELDQRNPIRITQMLAGESMVRLTPFGEGARGQRMIARGRGTECAMTILLDGMRVTGTLEELLNNKVRPPPWQSLMSLDELVPAAAVMAIEIYGSSISAPAELLRSAGLASCGIVAIWTGSRK